VKKQKGEKVLSGRQRNFFTFSLFYLLPFTF